MAVKKGYELTDLTGLHMLDAVDFERVVVKRYEGDEYGEDASVCRFRLDGAIWMAVEDPNDGYRSSMREVTKLRANTAVKLVNVFPPVQVLGVYHERRRYEACDILELYATANGKLLLTVGTENNDDYYPSFVANFVPENLPVNALEQTP
jgi:hypothetical protein